VAACLCYTGVDRFSGAGVFVVRRLRGRNPQRALLPSFTPNNDFQVREAVLQVVRAAFDRRGSDALVPGNVVTVEPGIYLPGLGGIRIEDLVIVRDDGPEILTTYTKELVVVS
jgi:hypothetical protein